MSQPEPETTKTPNYSRYAGLFVLLIVSLIVLNLVLHDPAGTTGIQPGHRMPPFAVPLVTSELQGEANVATHAHEGAAGNVPACSVRKVSALNICEQWEKGPVVLALFVNGGSCAKVLGDMQALRGSFPDVRFAAVSIEGDRGSLRRLVHSRGLTFPVGIDKDGALASLYKVLSCPQLTFAYPGGVVQSKPLLSRPQPAVLRARVAALLAAARARGWRPR
jgi:hypothetical protein